MNGKKNYTEKIKKIFPAVKPGLVFCLFALIYTILFNVSLTYMGNSASNSLSLVLNYLLGYLIIVVMKLTAFYLVLYSLFSIFFYYGVKGIFSFFGISSGERRRGIIVFLMILIFYLLQLFRSIIHYPQMYIDSFYMKNRFYAFIQESLTDYISPFFPGTLQVLILIVISAGIVYELFSVHEFSTGPIFRNVRVRFALAVFFILSVLFFTGDYFYTNRKLPEQKNIIIISSDALRPDHFSGSGYSRDTTPAIDRFMKESLVASNMNTITPRTFPSWVSILTSQYPHTHSIRNMFPSSSNRNREFVTLASLLRDKGYETSVAGDFAADIFPRINLGFNNVVTPTFNASVLMEQIILKSNIFITPFVTNRGGMKVFPSIREFAEFADPSYVVDDIKSCIDSSVKMNKPFFITSFFSVTHFPFSSPWPYYKKYTDPSYTGPSKYQKNRIVSLGGKDDKDDKSGEQVSTKDIENVRDLYDGCLRGFDDSFGEILKYLEVRGLAENTIVVLLSDHGENLYEYDNGMGHGEHLRGRWSLNVPFALRTEGVKPEVITRASSLLDVAPTVCDIMQIETPSSFEGVSIRKPLNRNFDAYMETGLWFDTAGEYFFQKKRLYYPDITGFSALEFNYNGEVYVPHHYFNLSNIAKHRAVKKGKYKLIYMPTSQGIEYELYNTDKDPDERVNIITSDRTAAEQMKKILFEFAAEDSGAVEIKGYLIPLFNEPVY